MARRLGVRQCVNQRQRHLSLAQIVARGLAYGIILEIVEDVVLDLERQSQQLHKLRQVGDVDVGGTYRVSAHLHTALKQRCRLLVYDAEISLLVN